MLALAGCSDKVVKQDLLGTWNCISSYDYKKEELYLPKDDEKFVVEFKSSTVLYWEDENKEPDSTFYRLSTCLDSIFLDSVMFVKGFAVIKKLDSDSLIVDWGSTKLNFVKVQ
jgi:hypothetical protein